MTNSTHADRNARAEMVGHTRTTKGGKDLRWLVRPEQSLNKIRGVGMGFVLESETKTLPL